MKRAAVLDKHDINPKSDYTPKVFAKSTQVKNLLLEAVTKNILFASYTAEEHAAIIDAHECIEYSAGDYIIRKGEQGNEFFIVESGSLDIYVRGAAGVESKVDSQLGVGSAFGELALMYNTPRAASIKATTKCVLWKIHRKSFREIVIYYKYQRNKTYIEFLKNVEVRGKKLGSCLGPGNTCTHGLIQYYIKHAFIMLTFYGKLNCTHIHNIL
jgi:hypothetical protein